EIIQKEFIKRSVDPLPQALVLTAIVIGLAVTLFLVFLTLQIYRTYGTLDIREIRRLRG
ncbi:MAG: sodium:proton antiporter, partial [Desulfurococcaceae archaeon]